MSIPPGIPPENIVPALRATERYAAIRELLQHLIHVGAIPRRCEESLFISICRREATMSTGIGYGIALPHTSSDVVAKPVMALGRSRTGIDFDSIDGKPVQAVVLMISPPFTHKPAN